VLRLSRKAEANGLAGFLFMRPARDRRHHQRRSTDPLRDGERGGVRESADQGAHPGGDGPGQGLGGCSWCPRCSAPRGTITSRPRLRALPLQLVVVVAIPRLQLLGGQDEVGNVHGLVSTSSSPRLLARHQKGQNPCTAETLANIQG
jgi:hypothetical protein